MRKLLIAGALGLLVLVAPGAARAGVQFSFGFGFPIPPVYVGPAPCYAAPCYPRPYPYYGAPVYPPVYYGPRHRGVYYSGGPRWGYKRYRRY
jgi:hypothetical protein